MKDWRIGLVVEHLDGQQVVVFVEGQLLFLVLQQLQQTGLVDRDVQLENLTQITATVSLYNHQITHLQVLELEVIGGLVEDIDTASLEPYQDQLVVSQRGFDRELR